MITVGINGFGRIGRCVLRAAQARDDLRVVAINDLAEAAALAHMFEFDSVHGRYSGPVSLNKDRLDIGQGPIRLTTERDPVKIDWQDVDIVMECTGFFRSDKAAAQHLGSAKKVLISAPGKGEAPVIVYGVNHDQLTPEHKIVSNGSCTTNCLAPVAHVLHSEFGIRRGTMTTIHSYTGTQPTHDRAGRNLARDRAGALNMVPTTTGAAKAIARVMPALKGRLLGTSVRVPVPNVSCIDLTVELGKTTTVEDINNAFQAAEKEHLKGVLSTEHRPLVSRDFLGHSASAIVQTGETAVIDGTLARVLAWYDNEWGFSNRMLDTASLIAQL